MVSPGGARLSNALRRGVVDGDPLARVPAERAAQAPEPTSRARYVQFTTLLDREQLPGQRSDVLEWPYVEGLPDRRGDAPSHDAGRGPLRQNAARPERSAHSPGGAVEIRVQGCKSIVSIKLTERQPATSWNRAAPDEYGFYANVNPAVDHPRWSQATERRIGELRRRPRCHSTAMRRRSPASTAGWTCGRATDDARASEDDVAAARCHRRRAGWPEARPGSRPAVVAGGLIPLAVLGVRAGAGSLGPDPVAEALNQLGLLALVLLVASLAATPLKLVLGLDLSAAYPQGARAARLLLRVRPLPDVCDRRSGPRRARDRRGHHGAPLHPRRLRSRSSCSSRSRPRRPRAC